MHMCVHMCEHVCVLLSEHMCVFERASALKSSMKPVSGILRQWSATYSSGQTDVHS